MPNPDPAPDPAPDPDPDPNPNPNPPDPDIEDRKRAGGVLGMVGERRLGADDEWGKMDEGGNTEQPGVLNTGG